MKANIRKYTLERMKEECAEIEDCLDCRIFDTPGECEFFFNGMQGLVVPQNWDFEDEQKG